MYPHLNLDGSYQSIGGLVKIFGLPPPPPGTPIPPTIIRTHFLEYALSLNLQYELDLWGKLKSIEKSALLEAEAYEMALLSTRHMVTADLASEYFQLRAMDTHLDLLTSFYCFVRAMTS